VTGSAAIEDTKAAEGEPEEKKKSEKKPKMTFSFNLDAKGKVGGG